MNGTIINEILKKIESMKQRNKSEEHMMTYVLGILTGLKLAGILSKEEAKVLKNDLFDHICE